MTDALFFAPSSHIRCLLVQKRCLIMAYQYITDCTDYRVMDILGKKVVLEDMDQVLS